MKYGKGKVFQWPVQKNYCFQCIMLDNICYGSCYEQLEGPACKNLNKNQALKAVRLWEDIVFDNADVLLIAF